MTTIEYEDEFVQRIQEIVKESDFYMELKMIQQLKSHIVSTRNCVELAGSEFLGDDLASGPGFVFYKKFLLYAGIPPFQNDIIVYIEYFYNDQNCVSRAISPDGMTVLSSFEGTIVHFNSNLTWNSQIARKQTIVNVVAFS